MEHESSRDRSVVVPEMRSREVLTAQSQRLVLDESCKSVEQVEHAVTVVERYEQYRNTLKKSKIQRFSYVFDIGTQVVSQFHEQHSDTELSIDPNILLHPDHDYTAKERDFARALLAAAIPGMSYETVFDVNRRKIESLLASDDISILFDPNATIDQRINRLESRIASHVRALRQLDGAEAETYETDRSTQEKNARNKKLEKQQKEQEENPTPPPKSNRSKPGMDEMERLKEGEKSPPYWTITPPIGGLYKQDTYEEWDVRQNVWKKSSAESATRQIAVSPLESKFESTKQTLQARVASGVELDVPLRYGYRVVGVECTAAYTLFADASGNVSIKCNKTTSDEQTFIDLSITVAESSEQVLSESRRDVAPPNFGTLRLTPETEAALASIQETHTSIIDRANALAQFVKDNITYSNDSSYNDIYEHHPAGYIGGIDRERHADCDVANTYFAALAAQIGITIRHTVGHSVSHGQIDSGTGHAWSEVFDPVAASWVQLDATPPGDPNTSDPGENKDGSNGDNNNDEPSEYVVPPTDQELRGLIEQLKEKKILLGYTKAELLMARDANITPEKARIISQEIQAAENLQLKNGKKIIDVLSQLFRAIVEFRKLETDVYDGPVTKKAGGRNIIQTVRHFIETSGGEKDPVTRDRIESETELEPMLKGMDVYIIGDKSGSMSVLDQRSKISLLQLQRQLEFLIFSSLHHFQRQIEDAGLADDAALDIGTMGVSFRGEDMIDVDKPYSHTFGNVDKVVLWDSLTQGDGGNGDVAALLAVKDQIEKNNVRDQQRLKIVISITDGAPTDPQGVQAAVYELESAGATVLGLGITSAAIATEHIYTTAKSTGKVVSDLDQIIPIVAKYVVEKAIALLPAESREAAKPIIDTVLQSFRGIST